MKLTYLTQVQENLSNYEFQEKYKILLDLETYISRLEKQADISQEMLYAKLGTPQQFSNRVIQKYNLVENYHPDTETQSLDTDSLLSVTQMDLDKQIAKAKEEDTIDIHPIANADGDSSQSSDDSGEKKTSAEIMKSVVSTPVKVFFTILSILVKVATIVILALSIIAASGVFFFVDVQTAITFEIGIVLFVVALNVLYNFIRTLTFNIIKGEFQTGKLVIMLVVIIISAIASSILVTSAVETVNTSVLANIDKFITTIDNFGINTEEIDWENLDLGEYSEIIIDGLKQLVFGNQI